MKHTIIASVGNNLKAVFIGISDFQAEQVILLSPAPRLSEAKMARAELQRFNVPCSIIEVKGNIWEELFVKIAEIKAGHPDKALIVNTATGDRSSMCAATSAAFVNGIKAFSVENNAPMLLPILKFSYYKVLNKKKLDLLSTLNSLGSTSSEALSKSTKMSLPLLSYHLNGNRKAEGLKELGLVEVTEQDGRTLLTISMLGRLLLKGHIQP